MILTMHTGKYAMRAFLHSLDEKVWLAIEVGWKKPEEPPATWDDTKIKLQILTIGH